MFKETFTAICDLIYPSVCILCRCVLCAETRNDSLCLSCQKTIEGNLPPFCQKCSRHLEDLSEGHLCRQCMRTSYHFDQVWAATLYNQTMTTLLHRFKYHNKTVLRRIFVKLILSFVRDYNVDLTSFDFLVPIPLHPARLRERGFNQSQFLADGLIKELPVAPLANHLIRRSYTNNQARLGKKERWTNIDGAFTIRNSSFIEDKNILLVDDLFTTGATISEAARTFKENGAKNVSALTLSIAN